MSSIVRFGSYEADLSAGQLRKQGVKINLRDQSFQVLASLLERRGEVVTREELQRKLWHDGVFVDFDNSLNAAVARLRDALCDSPDHPAYIETIPRRGYRFLAEVSQVVAPLPDVSARDKLVVLPFLNLSGDPTKDYLSDAITDELITELAAVAPQLLAVIARTTAMRYKGSPKDVASIGRELGVAYVLEGAVRSSNGHLSLNVQLIQTSDQVHLFAKRYEGELGDLFSLYHAIAHEIASEIPRVARRIRNGEFVGVHTRKAPTEDPIAYQLFLQGRSEMYKETPESLGRAKEYFEKAIGRDPQFAMAYDAIAEIYWWVGFLGFAPSREAFSAGLWACLRALEIDNTLAETHGLLAQLRVVLEFNWTEVEREVQRAMALNPASSLVQFRCAGAGLMPFGRVQEAAQHLQAALEFDPLSFILHCWLTIMLWLARDYQRALRQAQIFDGIFPGSYIAALLIGVIQRELGNFDDATVSVRRAVELSGGTHQMLGWLGMLLADNGKVGEARAILQQLNDMATRDYVAPTAFAWVNLGLGELDQAFAWMEKAIDASDPNIVPIKTFPFLDPIRSDPRFARLLRKMNLEP